MTKEHPGVEQYRPGRWRARGWDPVRRMRVTVPGGPFATERAAWVAKCKLEKVEDEQDAALEGLGQATPTRRRRRGAVADQPIGECVTMWIDEQVRTRAWRSPQSEECARSHQRGIVSYFGDLAIGKLDEDAVRRWTADLAERYSISSRKARLSVLSRSLDMAVGSRLLEDNPAGKVRVKGKVAPMEANRRRIAEWELYLLATYMPFWLYPALFLAHDSGLRLEEVCGLRWRNVHLDPRGEDAMPYAHVSDVIRKDGSEDRVTKNGKTRDVELTPETVDALRVIREAFPCDDPNGRVFRTPRSPRHAANDRCPQGTLQNAWETAREKARLVDPQPRFHDLRHAFGTALAHARHDPYTIQSLMGHSSINTTMIYVRAVPTEHRRRAIRETFAHRRDPVRQ